MLIRFGIDYIIIVPEYKQGHYYEVEGIVENYIEEIKNEKFTVNNVEFHYGVNPSWGYSLTLRKSVITGNGQYLRIRYIRIRDYNEIVYIEEIAED